MKRRNAFESRIYTQTLSDEFIRYMTDVDDIKDAKALIRQAVRRFERSYNAVATVDFDSQDNIHDMATIRVIRAQDADDETIKRGIQELQHYIANPD